ncbi:hypothetical protein SAMN05216331_101100 [Porphyromonadaceae bacterium KH3R12]|nr:hypothetical protein SAMN05216331_101100 [Porphyromonadaceae bacterium KH3R12]
MIVVNDKGAKIFVHSQTVWDYYKAMETYFFYRLPRFETFLYHTLSSGFLLSSLICLKWLGVSPVTFLN